MYFHEIVHAGNVLVARKSPDWLRKSEQGIQLVGGCSVQPLGVNKGHGAKVKEHICASVQMQGSAKPPLDRNRLKPSRSLPMYLFKPVKRKVFLAL